MTDGTLTFWGCRGSIPAPGPRTVVFGGNTSCVSIEYQSLVLIFDAGSGIRALGRYLLAREDIRQIRGCIFLTHTHWDHIQGLPFFTPAFSAKNRFAIYGEGNRKLSLVEVLEDQMHAPYFPVEMDRAYGAIVTFHEVHPRQKIVLDGEVTVAPFRLTHPNLAVGYVMKVADVRVAYVTDHEHETGRLSPEVLEMVRGVNVLIHDAQFTREELAQGKKGWGHSAWEDVVELAIRSDVEQLFLYHHDPDRSDEELNELQYRAQQRFPAATVAREGLKVPLTNFARSRDGSDADT